MLEGTCPTVTILRDGSPIIINESDYDPKVHELATESKKNEPEMTVAQLKAALTEKGIPFKPNPSKAELVALYKLAGAE